MDKDIQSNDVNKRRPTKGGALFALLLGVLASSVEAAAEFEWSGELTLQGRYFYNDAAFENQHERENFSLALQPEFSWEWEDSDQSLIFVPFARVDQHDDERTHADIRELYWHKRGDIYELRVGIRKVFWGVTESVHLVDIINQDDFVENTDGEDKLGQPMVNFALVTRDFGTFDFFLMPYFRERTLPGEEARLRAQIPFDDNDPIYESNAEETNLDGAVRWFKSIGSFDVGLSYFNGTNRDPRFTFDADDFVVTGVPGPPIALPGPLGGAVDPAVLAPLFGAPNLDAIRVTPTNPVLIPVYDQIEQAGLDVQFTSGSWLLKLEGIHRKRETERYTAAAAGFEYTFYGVFGTALDVGALGEYLYDERGKIPSDSPQADALRAFDRGFLTLDEATSLLAAGPDAFDPTYGAFDDDVFVGSRIGFNDVQGTQVLGGVIIDTHDHSLFGTIEASRRIGEGWTAALEMRWFNNLDVLSPLYSVAEDDYIQLEISRFF